MSEQRAAFDRAIDAWNAGDLTRYLELYSDRIQLHGYSEQPMAKSGSRGSEPGFTIVRFEGAQIVERHSLADFDTVVAQLTAPN